jgi:DNA-directed RNA polymerase subunit omega
VLSLREIATGRVKFDRDVREALSGKYAEEAKAAAAAAAGTSPAPTLPPAV